MSDALQQAPHRRAAESPAIRRPRPQGPDRRIPQMFCCTVSPRRPLACSESVGCLTSEGPWRSGRTRTTSGAVPEPLSLREPAGRPSGAALHTSQTPKSQWQAQQLTHGERTGDEPELRVRLTEELDAHPEDAVEGQEPRRASRRHRADAATATSVMISRTSPSRKASYSCEGCRGGWSGAGKMTPHGSVSRTHPKLAVDEARQADPPGCRPASRPRPCRQPQERDRLAGRDSTHAAMRIPASPPWNDMPPSQIATISAGWCSPKPAVDDHVAQTSTDDDATAAARTSRRGRRRSGEDANAE